MNALITIDAIPPGALTTAEIDATMAYAEAEKALATWAAYGLAKLRRVVCLQGRHGPTCPRRHRRRLSARPR